jgi:peroxin-1
LDRLVRVPFPDREERRAILAAVARDLAVTETGGGGGGVGESKVSEKGGVGKVSDALSMVWDDVAAKTEGFTGADLRALVSDASMHAVHRAIAKVSDEGGDGADDANAEDVRVTGKDVAKALEGARASVPASEREKLARAYAAFEGGRGARGSVGGAEESPGKRVSHA